MKKRHYMEMVLVSLILLSACSIKNKVADALGLPNSTVKEPVEIKDIEKITFSQSHSYVKEYEAYGIVKKEDGVKVLISDINVGDENSDEAIEYPCDDNLLTKAKEILIKYEVGKWNGFVGENKSALDGTSFSLNVTFTDKSTLSARGNNCFPDNYGSVMQELDELVEPYLNEYIENVSSDIMPISVVYYNGEQGLDEDFDEYIDTVNEYSVPVVFKTSDDVEDFKLYSISLLDGDTFGNIFTIDSELYSQSVLNVKRPLKADIAMIGTIPQNGISFKDAYGNTRYYAIFESGYDGSLFLDEITIE